MLVRDSMNTIILTIGPAHTLRTAARLMAARQIGAAVVIDPDTFGIGILTERDILVSIGRGQDPDRELAGDHLTSNVVFSTPDQTLDAAARAMTRGGFRHLIVLEEGDVAGIISVRDILRGQLRRGERPGELVA